MSSEDIDGTFFIAAGTLILGIVLGVNNCHQNGYKGGDCFTNSTCMPGFSCLHGDGHEPGTCVAAADGGARP